MEIKIGGAAVKQLTEKGEGVAVIATLNVVDADGDVTLPGAFGEQTVPMVPAHDWQAAPIGKARIHEEGTEVHADFKINQSTTLGRDWYAALRFDLDNPPPKQEYSYGFRVADSGEGDFQPEGGAARKVRFLKKLVVAEVSPVLKGAGVNTRTLALKSKWGEKGAVAPHKTATDAGAWDGPANERRVKADEALGYYRRIYAWQDPEADPKAKAAWRFIHHLVDGDGNPGAASTRACSAALAVLNGARGGTTIPAGDRKGVHAHLAKHMMDADMEPPELRSADGYEFRLDEELLPIAWDLETALGRVASIEMRGRLPGKDTKALLADIARLLGDLKAAVEAPPSEEAAARILARNCLLRKKILDSGVAAL